MDRIWDRVRVGVRPRVRVRVALVVELCPLFFLDI